MAVFGHREQTCGCQGGEGSEGGMDWEFGVSRCKLLHTEWINNKVLLYRTGNYIQYPVIGTSLVAQWLRIRLPMQGTRVRTLLQEDSTCRRATKPVRHKYWACALEPASHNYWSQCTQSPCSATREATAMRGPLTATKSSPLSPQLEKAGAQQQRPNAAKNNLLKNKEQKTKILW